jgi:hypothetical protein
MTSGAAARTATVDTRAGIVPPPVTAFSTMPSAPDLALFTSDEAPALWAIACDRTASSRFRGADSLQSLGLVAGAEHGTPAWHCAHFEAQPNVLEPPLSLTHKVVPAPPPVRK